MTVSSAVFRAKPENALKDAHRGIISEWDTCERLAIEQLSEKLPVDLAASVYKQYVAKWDHYMMKSGSGRSANIWFRLTMERIEKAIDGFPVSLSLLTTDGLRERQAYVHARDCHQLVVDLAGPAVRVVDVAKKIQKKIADKWGFTPKTPSQQIERFEEESVVDYENRVEDELSLFRIARLVDEKWWERKIEQAYRQFCEHSQIVRGRVRKGVSDYLSDEGKREFRSRKRASAKALALLVARNEETGEEINMLDIVKGSIANPAIRRHELMVRMRGFENIAQENSLIGGFFTLTAPSKYHAFTVAKNGKSVENKHYQGFAPKQTQKYLSAIWAKARAKLKRLNVELFGFRVCEPHHDATPHWHALFFFKPEHEQIIRYVLADYFTQENRDELQVGDAEFSLWGKFVAEQEQQDALFVDGEAQETAVLIEDIAKRISPRFDYKKIDPEKGSATGYIAKYIAKNIDGYKVNEDNEEPGTSADKAAEAVCGWSSLWGIRQFQQIGGPSVSVWRELRRLEPDTRVKQDDSIEVARIAADSGNWAMFIEAMGGIFCARADSLIRMVYKPVDNAYGEQVKKLKGIGSFAKTMITHDGAWSIFKADAEGDLDRQKNDSSLPWSSVNNCTVVDLSLLKQAVFDHFNYLGVELDDHLLGPAMQGCRIKIPDGRRVWLVNSDIGFQMRFEEAGNSKV
ncbi:MAG: hypothetical protein ACJAZP_003860 [Psychromonas sp.]|jgi:hypothetical protein|uniref:replication endonuclease n=1 Tax=Psychromonas sp. TaxID=1884585 RepID=UPI0039E624B8